MTPAVTVENLGFPPRERLKGIVETVEVLAYKAVSFAMDHFALECVGGCICQRMLEGVFVCVCVCVFVCVCVRVSFSASVLDFSNSLILPSSSAAAAE